MYVVLVDETAAAPTASRKPWSVSRLDQVLSASFREADELAGPAKARDPKAFAFEAVS